MNHNYGVIMAGGIGSKFWPVSRTNYPKQFLDILGTGQTLIQQAFIRMEKLVPSDQIYIVTSTDYTALVEQQLPGMPKKNILSETEKKSTAPCIAYTSFRLFKEDADATVIVAPADHLISDDEEFFRVCRLGQEFVLQNNALVTLGIQPTHANTSYGYIQYDKEEVAPYIFKVKEFKEKLTRDVALEYVSRGDYLWNSGIFIWKVTDILDSFQKYLPQVYQLFNNELPALNTLFEKEVVKKIYADCPDISIDSAILEKADNVFIIPALFAWSDLGTWTSAWENMDKDENKNAVSGNVILIESANCVVSAPDNKLIVLQGLNNYIIVDTSDMLLICEKKKEPHIKEYVQQVRSKKEVS